MKTNRPSTVALAGTVFALVAHEVLYHLTGGDDFPVGLLRVADTELLNISHGGLDMLGLGLFITFLLLAREWRAER